jgi:TetR/AcrR family transcriptional regulator, transcriptional repressor for nem operon
MPASAIGATDLRLRARRGPGLDSAASEASSRKAKFERDTIPTGLYSYDMSATTARAPETTRRKILEAAFDEFYKNGFQGGSINRIVSKAGTTKGALFHHFKGKNDLGHTVVEEIVFPDVKKCWLDPVATSADPIGALKKVMRQFARQADANGRLIRGCPLNNLAQEMAPLNEGFRRRLEKIYSVWREALEAAFSRGIKAGTVKKGISPPKVAALVVAALEGIIGTAKNAQSMDLLKRAGQGLFDYLDTLRP